MRSTSPSSAEAEGPRWALLLAFAAVLAAVALAPSSHPPPPPDQPMPFSHRIHAGEQRLGCAACHAWAERSPRAGLPPMSRCQGCHRFIKEDRERPDRDEALRRLAAWLKRKPPEPIPWARVHRLPDHVRFDHGAHLRAGQACQRCHGDVARMERVRQVASLRMGWCLACHRASQAERPAGRAHLTECLTCHR